VDGYIAQKREKCRWVFYALFILCFRESAGRAQWPDFASPDILAQDIDAIKMKYNITCGKIQLGAP